MALGGVLFMSLRIELMWGNTILRMEALNKSNISIRSVKLSLNIKYIQGVFFVISITPQCSYFPVRSHMPVLIGIQGHTPIDKWLIYLFLLLCDPEQKICLQENAPIRCKKLECSNGRKQKTKSGFKDVQRSRRLLSTIVC